MSFEREAAAKIARLGIGVAHLAVLLCVATSGAAGQTQRQTFGEEGRLFSRAETDDGRDAYYLLERASYVGEDSRGFMGRVRIVRNYKSGGYEVLFREFTVACHQADDGPVVIWRTDETGKTDAVTSLEINSPERAPTRTELAQVNLYWA